MKNIQGMNGQLQGGFDEFDCTLEIEGVKGESQISGYEDQIDVVSWNLGMSQAGTAHIGSGSGASRVSVQDLRLTKYVDSSTHALMRACCNGKHFPKATLTLRKAGGSTMAYGVFELEQVMVTSVDSGSVAHKGRQVEGISLNFAKFSFAYTPQDEKGSAGAEKIMKYDIAKNVAE